MLLALLACTGDAQDSAAVCGDTPADTWAPALTRDGDTLQFVLDTVPAPPDKGNNVWTLSIDGAEGATVTITPFMVEHEHGTNPAVVPTTEGPAGTWVSDPFNLFMGGLWEFTMDVSSPADSVVYRFCIQG